MLYSKTTRRSLLRCAAGALVAPVVLSSNRSAWAGEHKMPELPYARDALAPRISRETLDFHYGKHLATYVQNLNKLIKGTALEDASLEEIVRRATGPIFNNAAQAWNHAFYFRCLSPNGGGQPSGKLAESLAETFGSFEKFKQQFTEKAATLFGSGWAWLVRTSDGKLALEQTSNAGSPLRDGKTPLLTCDVWEHAYYIDYRNARPKYIDAFWHLVHWEFVAAQLG
jgi:Fe-Mn family superoxide dismutase